MAAAAAVRGGPLNLAQVLAIPAFVVAVAATWTIAQASTRQGPILVRLLLEVHFFLLGVGSLFSVATEPSADPHGLMAGVAVMMAVCAMACQYALLRLAMAADGRRLQTSLCLLVGFLGGCLVAAVAVSLLADWAWSLPVALAALAIALPSESAFVAGRTPEH